MRTQILDPGPRTAPRGTAPGAAVHPVVRRLRPAMSAGLLVLVAGLGVLVVGLPAAVGGMPLTVLSGSMEPTYSPGDLVVVKPTPADEVRPGDVLTYQLRSDDPARVTHRVLSRSVSSDGEISFVTRGDANAAPDEQPVRDLQVVGTVWYHVPWVGWANHAISGATRQWLVPAVAGGLLLYAAWTAVSGLRERSRRRAADDAAGRTKGLRRP